MAKNKKKKKKIVKWIIIGVIALFIAFIVINAVNSKNDTRVQVTTMAAAKGSIEQVITASGTVKSDSEVTYYAPTAVKVDQVNVKVGDAVKKGDVLVTFDQSSIDLSISQNNLKLLAENDTYASTISDDNTARNKYTTATSKVDEIQAAIDAQEDYIYALENGIKDELNAKKEDNIRKQDENTRLVMELERQEAKFKQDHPNYMNVGDQLDDVQYYDSLILEANAVGQQLKTESALLEADFTASENKDELLRLAKKDLEKLNTMLSEAKTNKSSSEASKLNDFKRQALTASNEFTNLQITDANNKLALAQEGIVAEFDGIVSAVSVKPGATTTEGAAVLTIQSATDINLVYGAGRADLEKIAVGQEADITIAGHEYKGKIKDIARIATVQTTANNTNSTASTVDVTISIEDPDDYVYLGISGKATIHTAKNDDTIIIPISAVNVDREGEFCYIVQGDVAKKVYVKTGITSSTEIEIVEGIKEGDQVITLINTGLQDGSRVLVTYSDVRHVEE